MIMFRMALAVLGVFLLTCSCKKDWYCACKTNSGEDIALIIEKAKYEEANEVCILRAERSLDGQSLKSCTLAGKYKEGEDNTL